MSDRVIVIDALSVGSGKRTSSRDSIGCGPRSVAGAFERRDVECRIVRAEAIRPSWRWYREFDHIAISAMTMDLPVTKTIVHQWRHVRPRGRVLLGGPIALDPVYVLKEIQPDILVIGEGEETLDMLLALGFPESDIPLDTVAGVGYLDS